jgi:Leucine-rich repeat (LRR) protein
MLTLLSIGCESEVAIDLPQQQVTAPHSTQLHALLTLGVLVACSALQVLDIGFHGLVDHLPPSLGNLQQLQRLTVDCASLNDLPDSISRLTTLTWLTISHCLGLQQLPEGLGNLQQLRVLVIDTVPHVDALPASIGLIESLEELHLLNDSEFDGLPKLPQQMEGLTNLTKLHIGTVPGIQHELPNIPGSIGVLAGLRELQIGKVHLVAVEK